MDNPAPAKTAAFWSEIALTYTVHELVDVIDRHISSEESRTAGSDRPRCVRYHIAQLRQECNVS